MEYIQDKHVTKLSKMTLSLLDETNSAKHDDILRTICNDMYDQPSRVVLSEHILDELRLPEWISQYSTTRGGKCYIKQFISNPIHDSFVLKARCDIIRSLSIHQDWLKVTRNTETTLCWLLNLPINIKDAYPLSMLFPTWPILHRLNHVNAFILLFSAFKTYIAPFMNIAYPLTSIFGPYYYIRRYLKINMSFATYMAILKTSFAILMRPSGNIKADAIKYVSTLVYVIIYVYTTYNGFEFAFMNKKLKDDICAKWKRIYSFIQTAKCIDATIPTQVLSKFANILPETLVTKHSLFTLDDSLSSLYKLITTPSMRDELTVHMKNVFIIDIINCAQHVLNIIPGWSLCTYGSKTQMWAMGHPLLTSTQVRNPVLIDKNMTITGPNAAGKTTYMKAICANMIMAQSLGICCSVRNTIHPVEYILTSMNIIDNVGRESLFEAEVRRCKALVHSAVSVFKNKQNALFFLDEPMHSTPPIEGAATAMAVVEYLGKVPGVHVFLTTHYHHVTKLSQMYPMKWINVSMEAHIGDDCSYTFPFRIRHGPSFQCIALELLKERSLPQAIIDSAIEMKNKICNTVIENDI